MFCKNCGAENRNDSKFCLHCGAKLGNYLKPNENLIMPNDIKMQQQNKSTRKICSVLYIIAICSLLLSGVAVFCSLFFFAVPLIIVSGIFMVVTIGLGIANLTLHIKQKKKNKQYKQDRANQTNARQKLPPQTLPPQDDQINYKR